MSAILLFLLPKQYRNEKSGPK